MLTICPTKFARHRVAVAHHAHQAGARHLARQLDVAVEGSDHRHQAGLLVFEHLGNASGRVLGMRSVLPQ
jgi:hypothetical protein